MTPPAYVVIEGFKCYAPESAYSGRDFPCEGFERLYRLEDKNFWFRGRQRIIEHQMRRFLSGRRVSFLEIGCGTGFVLRRLSSWENLELTGAERTLEGLRWAQQRLRTIPLIQLDATRIPFQACFDALGAFDVVEHIEDDRKVFQQMHAALKEDGFLFLTVPQHPWLWSETDERAFHKRRYTRQELSLKLQEAGFRIRFISSFVSLLLPAMALSRRRGPRNTHNAFVETCELELSPWLNSIGELCLRFEEALMRWGIRLPFGGSLIAVAQK